MLSDRVGVMSARPGASSTMVTTGWPRERDSRIVADRGLRRRHRAAVVAAARRIAEGASAAKAPVADGNRMAGSAGPPGRDRRLRRRRSKMLCRTGAINPLTLHAAVRDGGALLALFASGKINDDMAQTFSQCRDRVRAVGRSVGFAVGALIHALAARCAARSIRCSLRYYSMPFFVFYPLLIVAVRARTRCAAHRDRLRVRRRRDGDRDPQRPRPRAARAAQDRARPPHEPRRRRALLHRPAAPPRRICSPALKLALAYSFIGVIAGEFILSGGGLGYRHRLRLQQVRQRDDVCADAVRAGRRDVVNARAATSGSSACCGARAGVKA